jgi:hypothetical protein
MGIRPSPVGGYGPGDVRWIVYTPTYTLLGVDYRGRAVYQTVEGGFNSIWAYDPATGERRLVSATVHWPGEVSLD